MTSLLWIVALIPVVAWVGLLLLPWRPCSTREHIEPDTRPDPTIDLGDITALIPARNEADVIGATLDGLRSQGSGLQVIVVDDQSSDATAEIAAAYPDTRVIAGLPLPAGWVGKLWALEQGKADVHTTLTLLLDADIRLQPGLLAALLAHKRGAEWHLVSLMADLRRTSFWDRLLLPVFVYYFKLLYPFALSNSRSRYVAAAAGGCILVDTRVLQQIGAFACMRDALIDDCSLARQVKNAGYRTWLGLSRGVISSRAYGSLGSIHDMVARSAFTQLRHSLWLLLALTLVFILVYGLPLALLGSAQVWPLALVAWLAMMAGYLPVLRYYQMSPLWAVLLPVSAALYLMMTWSSAIRHWRGEGSRWKNRTYGA